MNRRREPYVREENEGTRAICACGRSSMPPYCDGAHLGSGTEPFMVSLPEGRTVAWCGCGKSNERPVCDGTHRMLRDEP